MLPQKLFQTPQETLATSLSTTVIDQKTKVLTNIQTQVFVIIIFA